MNDTTPQSAGRTALNPVLRAIAEHSPHYIVAKVQPPDGLILRLPDGSCWAVNSHPVYCPAFIP